ncbi:YcnI family protein [Gordonia sp. ABSL1-1]|uniref:YcnI family copper-binding membrane protein n=1 Tax=Gordonia sp. ABSL1-1 TaxID=3053923 RepID=UPI002573D9F4|nr:YcnI family protein [Gordonia sp. ABSL1-1]MDL9936001.1 YcnI family protein [Gordonia sp. ABSL1-1]
MRVATATRRLLVPTAAAAAVSLASLLAAPSASAHVTANAPTVTQGGAGVVTLVVPNESDTPTVSVRVTLPNLKRAYPQTSPGWKAVVVKDTASDTVTGIVWTADRGQGIPVGQFGEFRLLGGAFPEQASVSLPTVQIYESGEKVEWTQPANPDGSEPERPAPTLTLPAGTGDHHGGHGQTPPASSAASMPDDHDAHEMAAPGDATDDTARWIGGIGLLIGALGTVVAVAALTRSRRTETTSTESGSDDA